MAPVSENDNPDANEPVKSDSKSRTRASLSGSLDAESGEEMAEMPTPRNVKVRPVEERAAPKNVAACRMDRYACDKTAARDFFRKEPCLHTHRIFERAAQVFAGLKKSKEKKDTVGVPSPVPIVPMPAPVSIGPVKQAKMDPLIMTRPPAPVEGSELAGVPPLEFNGPYEKKLTFELAFASLKYQGIFEDMLDDVAFFSENVQLREEVPLVMVVLWDYQSRKFQTRVIHEGEVLDPLISKIENAVARCKTKLAASLARRRIKAQAPTIEYLLPENLRKMNSQQQLPTYCWVNTARIHAAELMQRVRDEGFIQLWTIPRCMDDYQDKSFHVDVHCSDVLVFSMDCNAVLQEHDLVEEGLLVRQDKSSCLAAQSVVSMLGDDQDVVVLNPGAGMIAAHVAVLLRERKGNVVVFSDQPDDEQAKMFNNFEKLGVSKHVKVVRDSLEHLDEDQVSDSSIMKNVRAALIMAKCSKSAISNIVNFIVTEGENMGILQEMAQSDVEMEQTLNQLQAVATAQLRAVLKLHRLHGAVYCTRSMNEIENEGVVQRAIEYVNMLHPERHLPHWRVIPPVIPYTSHEIDEQIGIEGKYVRYKPTTMMNGCFIATMAREPDDSPSHRARAMARRSTIHNDDPDDSGEIKKKSTKKGRRKSQPHHGNASTNARVANFSDNHFNHAIDSALRGSARTIPQGRK